MKYGCVLTTTAVGLFLNFLDHTWMGGLNTKNGQNLAQVELVCCQVFVYILVHATKGKK